MVELKPTEWLALQRHYCSNPRKALADLASAHRHIRTSTQLLSQAVKDLATLKKEGVELIPWNSRRYPKILKEIYDPPIVLLAKGDWPVWEERPWVSVVGARKATTFGKTAAREIAQELVKKGFGIVSGLAYGIDAEAHKAALEAGGVTWGVLGSGIDTIYPAINRTLAQKMMAKGGVLSEFPLGTQPYAGNFPQRNRIVSGLSQAVIIIEATLKSGSLITARFGLEQGREVFVVPPPKEHVAYEGNKKLLDEGATPYEGAEQVLNGTKGIRSAFCAVPTGRQVPRSALKTTQHDPLLSLLKKPQSLESLVQKTQKPAQKILADLTNLESEKRVKKLPGALWQSL